MREDRKKVRRDNFRAAQQTIAEAREASRARDSAEGITTWPAVVPGSLEAQKLVEKHQAEGGSK